MPQEIENSGVIKFHFRDALERIETLRQGVSFLFNWVLLLYHHPSAWIRMKIASIDLRPFDRSSSLSHMVCRLLAAAFNYVFGSHCRQSLEWIPELNVVCLPGRRFAS